MAEDEVYPHNDAKYGIVKGIITPLLIILVIVAAIEANAGKSWEIICLLMGVLTVAGLIWYRKVAKSATLKTDTLALDNRMIPFRDIVSVMIWDYSWYSLLPPFKPYGTIYVRDKDRTQFVYVDAYNTFMNHLAERMENSGIRIKKKTLWNGLKQIINLDLQKKH